MFTFPHLRAQTTRLPHTPVLSQIMTSQRGQIAWLKDNTGFVCAGQAARFSYEDPGMTTAEDGRRFALASQWWQELSKRTEVRDEVRTAGSGLVGFGSFSFAPHSPAGSVLIVPQVIVGISGPGTGDSTSGHAFLTLIGPDDEDIFDTLSDDARALLDAVLVGHDTHYTPMGAGRAEPTMSFADYQARVTSIKKAINANDVSKVVLARQINIACETPIDERQVISTLAQQYQDCWTFGIDGLIGATPELLAQSQEGEVVTRVLAGTFPRDEHHAPDALLHSPKNVEEHQVAVQSAEQSLQKIGDVRVGQPFVLDLPNVRHLATDISTMLNVNGNVLSVAGMLHPTAALGGSPKNRALELISKLEPNDRDRFGAPVGWIGSDGAGQWCVALRCARIDSELGARAWAGGGIMADSDPTEEYVETQAKFAPIMAAFQL
ncbi:isochorismate synthase [Arcanobacterium buesumense]|uniref:isochorismate synthase n=1 Tax=Arcanobacterium buesumense TaxID=2722751 RepID=A0A6H2EIB1_9ACTO|nr:isochorismate synthase [Arcanobacterium buesumense]QJC21305.1 isochorismate synthase [Arcanobacterium buesumense]